MTADKSSKSKASTEESLSIPGHLLKYTIEQDYSRYTPVDHAVWRHILRQLTKFLSVNAHPAYMNGLESTGISLERIPRISEISDKLKKFGWRAVPVSGFLPPAVFMELQAYGVLPIASDMRSIDHLTYTPAPDIVHEAAGHAPILAVPEYAAYLKKYAQIARRAIISKQDMEQYDAIRVLSDIKENPESTTEDISHAEQHLEEVNRSMKGVSEAALLSRMNWWTAEYGLIGKLDRPKIFGAGLLSSVGESRDCLSSRVKKIPLTEDCVHTSYDITEPQPQLFVTPDFDHLGVVLDNLAKTMSFVKGGLFGIQRAIEAETINTAQLDSGLQISGQLKKYWLDDTTKSVCYLSFSGPCQLAYGEAEIEAHGKSYHAQGYGAAIGRLKGWNHPLFEATDSELKHAKIETGHTCRLEFISGVIVEGRLRSLLRKHGKILLMSFDRCKVTRADELLFDPDWGTYDMSVGESIPSVFGGPADREAFGELSDFPVRRVPPRKLTAREVKLHELYKSVRDLREFHGKADSLLSRIADELQSQFPSEWLLWGEVYEVAQNHGIDALVLSTRQHLQLLARANANWTEQIAEILGA